MSAVFKQAKHSISTLLVRLEKLELLVPKPAIVEVISWNRVLFSLAKDAGMAGVMGYYAWNDRTIPLLSLDPGGEVDQEFNENRRKIVVLRAVEGEPELHYALLTRGLPKPVLLDEHSLHATEEDSQLEAWFKYKVSIGNRLLRIPDFLQLEKLVLPAKQS